jgi:hypothetical protein
MWDDQCFGVMCDRRKSSFPLNAFFVKDLFLLCSILHQVQSEYFIVQNLILDCFYCCSSTNRLPPRNEEIILKRRRNNRQLLPLTLRIGANIAYIHKQYMI